MIEKSVPGIKVGNFVRFERGKSKKLVRGMVYKVESGLKVDGLRGRGLEFKQVYLYHKTNQLAFFGFKDWLSKYTKYFDENIETYSPNLVKGTIDQIAITDQKTSERVYVKPGKAFKRMFPELGDPAIEWLVDKFKEEYGPEEYTIVKANTKEEITRIMRGPKTKKRVGFSTTRLHKGLFNSCMRHAFSQYDYHPYSVYDSDESEVWFVMNQKNQMCARCVVFESQKVYMPIYAANRNALEFIKKNLQGYGSCFDNQFFAKLSLIPTFKNSRYYLTTYLDCGNLHPTPDCSNIYVTNMISDFPVDLHRSKYSLHYLSTSQQGCMTLPTPYKDKVDEVA